MLVKYPIQKFSLIFQYLVARVLDTLTTLVTHKIKVIVRLLQSTDYYVVSCFILYAFLDYAFVSSCFCCTQLMLDCLAQEKE